MTKIVGIRRVDYMKDDRNIKGYSLHLTELRNDVVGEAVYSEYINDKTAEALLAEVSELEELLGREVQLYYNRFRKVDAVQVVG